MNFKVSAKSAIGILSLLVGYADAAGTHPADALLKRDDGIAATGPADFPLRMSRKRLMDFPPIIRGGKAPPLLNSTQQDVGAQIVGGDPVDPPRKYSVRTTLCHRVKTFAASYADFDYSVTSCSLLVLCLDRLGWGIFLRRISHSSQCGEFVQCDIIVYANTNEDPSDHTLSLPLNNIVRFSLRHIALTVLLESFTLILTPMSSSGCTRST